jgi:hypothetical protein
LHFSRYLHRAISPGHSLVMVPHQYTRPNPLKQHVINIARPATLADAVDRFIADAEGDGD